MKEIKIGQCTCLKQNKQGNERWENKIIHTKHFVRCLICNKSSGSYNLKSERIYFDGKSH